MEWVTIYWELISASAVLLVALANALTKHFSHHAGLVRALIAAIGFFSMFKSKDVPGWLKWPFTPDPPPEEPHKPGPVSKIPPIVGVMLILVLSACGTWQQTVKVSLDEAGVIANDARPLVQDYYKGKCEGVAKACYQAGDTVCVDLVDCQSARAQWYTTLKAIHTTRLLGYGALRMNLEETATGYAIRAAEMVVDLLQALKKGGVL